ncbi:molecular chaperone HtpG [Ferruginibacter sp. HRS2-29]|uniref:molecular chaperone HtpG n=1 Tax=Ferruginibacter sp. HRS2-29 TaxID=2487334 RepID=UPI0020CD03A9|nr:molecular chaperone HtpG [Ferruginibacter sp. HRS2-29]MCP9750861.1 molecular chaperone HtpG [Ferruginibacter sp. HRS2-29]
MQKGNIRVQTENIFPIIKKFLYSEHDIFIRELVSNAVDATQKLKTLSSIGEAKGDLGELRIDVTVDAEKKTITISDRGVGMTEEEVDKYLNQVAFSGAEEFLQKYKGQNENNIIGHFGLGFYSSFMVSEKVEVVTKSFREGAQAVRWICDGSPEFTLEPAEKELRGTDIILHINEESKEFLDAYKVKSVLEKFCKFLPVSIYFHDANEKAEELKEGETAEEARPINNTHPAWTKKPSELTKEDYENFYKELYPFSETPLFWIHLNVDYPFNLTGILYFPKIKQSYEIQKDKIQLYSNQVFVTDEVKDIVPEFLMLLHGVIDSPDIPLNVSRSYLQGDPNVKKINAHITKKVADKLEEIFNNDRPAFEEKWESLGLFVKYGMMTDDKFLDKATKFFVLQDTNGKFYTLEEYKTATSATQKNKEGKQVILYTTNPVAQDAYVQQAIAKGYIVVKMETLVDAAFISNVEMKWSDSLFTRVDADIADNLIDKSEGSESVLSKEEAEKLKTLFEQPQEGLHISVEVKGLSADAPPVTATRPEQMRRMKEMASMGGGMAQFYAQMPDEVNITVNGNHAIYKNILAEKEEAKQEKLVKNLADLALLSQGLLTGKNLTEFINRSVQLMEN